MAQLLLHGTNFVNFVGLQRLERARGRLPGDAGHRMGRAAGGDRLLPAPLRLSRLLAAACRAQQSRADRMDARRDLRRKVSAARPTRSRSSPTSSRARAGAVRCLQHRGEYMYVAEGDGGFMVYDIASVGNKGFSERILTGPFSPLGHDTRVGSRNATCMALPTNQPIRPDRNDTMAATERPQPDGRTISLLEENQEQRFHPIYNYAAVTDAEEGLILVNVNTMSDGELRNNFLTPRRHLERERRAQRRAAHRAGRPLRLHHRRCRPGRGRPRRSAPSAAGGARCRSATAAPRRSSSATSG